jgi:2-polyprenyl-6-hydroxyphenyl methylase/3-demethylubiquinone-9 3-methyltransferase
MTLHNSYSRINNEVYNTESDSWWQPDSALYLLKNCINPVRINYAKKILDNILKTNPRGKSALEVGCGGGILCEEIAGMQFDTTGIDPSEQSLRIATRHAEASGLCIRYEAGTGEAIPYGDASYDVVFCCDVLEHVRDLPRVISEISRVLKPEGIFFYDTLNRTFASRLVAINISQKWQRWAFMPADLHVWEMFIKPQEMKSLLRENNLEWKEHRGTAPNVPYLKALRYLRKRAKGELTYIDLSEKLFLVESANMSVMYMGYAIKKPALHYE